MILPRKCVVTACPKQRLNYCNFINQSVRSKKTYLMANNGTTWFLDRYRIFGNFEINCPTSDDCNCFMATHLRFTPPKLNLTCSYT